VVDRSDNGAVLCGGIQPSLINRSCPDSEDEGLSGKPMTRTTFLKYVTQTGSRSIRSADHGDLMEGSLESDLLTVRPGTGRSRLFRYKHHDPDSC